MYARMILKVGSAGKRSTTTQRLTDIGTFPSMSSYMNLAYIGRGKGTTTPFVRTLEWAFTCDTVRFKPC